MKRVMIIGSPGTGKTTFARKLAEKTGLPLEHLDYYYHDSTKEYYEGRNKEAWRAKVMELVAEKKWIMDGNFGSTMAERAELADTIFYFNLPRLQAMSGVLRRRIEYHHKKREEMPDNWKESANWEFLKYVWTFKKAYAEATKTILDRNSDKKVITFTSRKQADDYLKML